MKGFSFPFRIVNILLACLQNMTMGGILFGWASISGGLLASPPSEGGAGLSEDYLQMMFVTAAFFSFLGPLLLGIILDYFGPRVCSLTSIFLICIGCVLFGLSDRDQRPYFLPALCLIAFGGPGAQSAIIHLANLFPNWKATTTAFLTGSFQLSFIIFLIFDQLWLWKNISYSKLFFGYTFICLLNAVVSFWLWPDTPYTFEEQLAEVEEISEIDDDEMQISIGHIRLPSVFIHHSREKPKETAQIDQSPSHKIKMSPTFDALKDGSLLDQVKSAEFIRLVIFFLINSFWVNFYIGSFNVQLGDDKLVLPDERGNYGRLFTLIITCGVIAIPLIGTIMDKYSFPVASTATSFFGLLWITFLLAETKGSLLFSFMCYSMFRTFLFTFVFAYLADTLGFKYFGVLAGIMFVLAGVLSFIQVPLVKLVAGTCHLTVSHLHPKGKHCSHGSWKELNVFIGFMIFATFYFSYLDWIRRERNRVLEEIALNRQQQMSLLSSKQEDVESDDRPLPQSLIPSFDRNSNRSTLSSSSATATNSKNQKTHLKTDHRNNRSYGSVN